MSTQQNPSSPALPPATETEVFQRIESYPFSTDPEFQSGLSTILSSNPAQDPELLTLRACCFYFSRKHHISVDFEAYKKWRSERSLPSANVNRGGPVPETQTNGIAQETGKADESPLQKKPDESAAPYPSSFSQIVDLITKGEPIPGIREIPDTILVGQESSPATVKRKKPWEKDQALEEASNAILEGHG
ncbi:MAG: hypothetical protein L6R36_001676 [Xanthoria steineri]|nr:MAG: hypothetical protein L6R36_001676 [Xanthoria steineri]